MKRKRLGQVFLLFALAGMVYACNGSEELVSPEEAFIAESKAWFENQAPGGTLLWKQGTGGIEVVLTPDWRWAFSDEKADCKVTEVHLNGAEQFSMTTSECAEKYQQTKDKRYLAWKIQLVIRTGKDTNAKDGFIMVAYPDLPYLEAHKDDPLKGFTYLKRPSDFGGMVIFYHLNGEFSNGWVYVEGTAYPIQMAN